MEKDLAQSKETVSYVENANISATYEDNNFDDSIEDTPISNAAWVITFTVSLGGFLFGYDTGVISAVLVSLKTSLGHELSANEQELITSLTSGGALLGAIIAGLTADKFGRKLAIYIGCVLFVLGALLQATAYSVGQMSVGRLVVGLGVGSAAMIVPLYIGEIAPARTRGRMIAFDNVSVTLGQLVSYGIGAGLTPIPNGWRYMVAIGAVPAIVLAGLLKACPQSPRQLITHGKRDEAMKVLRRVFPQATEEQVVAKVRSIEVSVETHASAMADKSLWWQFKQLHTVGANLRPLISACAVMAISQLGGFNTLMYYSSVLFGLVGFNKPVAVSVVVGATNFVFTFLNMVIIDKFGRRIVLLVTVMGMCLSMVVAAIAFHFIPISPDLVFEATSVNWAGTLVLVTIVFYVAFFASGVATIGWVGTELLPQEVRALGTMMNTVTCWGCNVIIASTFLSMMKGMTPSGAFGFYAAVCGFGWLFILFAYPEVKGLPLEQIRDIYKTGFGVKKGAQLQRENRQALKDGKTAYDH